MVTTNRTSKARENEGRRTVSGGLTRIHGCKGRLGSAAVLCLFVFVSTLALTDGGSVIENINGRENLSKAFSHSNPLPENTLDQYPTRVRAQFDTPHMVSRVQSDQQKRRRLSGNADISGSRANNAQRKEFDERNDQGLFGLRKLGNETMVNTTTNATLVQDVELIDVSRTALFVLAIILGVIAASLSIVSSIFVHLYRNNKLVAIGQPPFLQLVCFGSFLLASDIFLLFRYQTEDQLLRDSTCIAELWLKNLGTVVVHMAVFCKLWRAYKVAQFRKNQTVLPQHVIWPFLLMMAAVIAVTITHNIIDPPILQELMDPDLGYVGMCLPKSLEIHSMHGPDFWIDLTTIALELLSLLLMSIMAWITRNIPEDISDSRHVFYAIVANIAVIIVTSIPFWIGVSRNQSGLTSISRSIRYFFDSTIYVGFLVVPKIYSVWSEKHRTSTDTGTSSIDSTPKKSSGSGGRGGQVHVRGLNAA